MDWKYDIDNGLEIVDENGCFVLDIVPITNSSWKTDSNKIYDTSEFGDLINLQNSSRMSFESMFMRYKESKSKNHEPEFPVKSLFIN